MSEPNPAKIDRIFAKAVERRTKGRTGLYMQSRYPNEGWENGMTFGRYSVFHGFSELFEDFETWLTRATGAQVHGHVFGPDRADFSGRQRVINGALGSSPKLRDYNSIAFLTNLIWNTRGERQCFQVGPRDEGAPVWFIAKDPKRSGQCNFRRMGRAVVQIQSEFHRNSGRGGAFAKAGE